jgi:hypothetical protein
MVAAILKRASQIGIALVSVVAFLLSQQVCAIENFLGAETSHTHTTTDNHHSHSPSDHDHNSHDPNNSKGSDDTCCKNAPSLFLTQSATAHPEKVLLQLDVVYNLIIPQFFSDYVQQTINPPYLKQHRNALISLSLAPNAPPFPA